MRASLVARGALVTLLAPWFGCGGTSAPSSVVSGGRPDERHTGAVVLVAVDGVRWQDVFEGVERERAEAAGVPAASIVSGEQLMPNLHRLGFRNGAVLGAPGHGPEIRASGPNHVSLPGYAELLTGRSPSPCVDNRCRPALDETLLDEIRAVPGTTITDVAFIASWEGLGLVAAANAREVVVSVGRHGGPTREHLAFDASSSALVETAEASGPLPGTEDFRPDALTAELALRYLVHYRPRFLFVGLGEPDEYGHRDDYAGYLGALGHTDAFIGELTSTLGALGAYGEDTTVIVTTDHGRSADFVNHGMDPESARVWLFASGGAVRAQGAVSASAPRKLADVAPTIRALLGLSASSRPDAGTRIAELLPGTPPGGTIDGRMVSGTER